MDPSEACGGPNRISLYTSTASVTVYPVPVVQTTNLPGNWQYSECLAYVLFLDSFYVPGRCSLVHSEPAGGGRVFPYQIIFPLNDTAQNCLSLCSTYGYPAAGMENGDECCM
jgi:hypothetical protein